MADPLSVAGLAAGVVSLGLQVASGITSYLDAIKGRQEEVASVKRELDSITSTLQRLDSICSQTQAQHPASTILRQSIEACRIELDNLGNIPACIQSLNPQQGPSSSTQNVDARLFKKLMETQEHLAYPLRHAAKVQKLASQLRNLRESLQTSLQEVTIELSLSMAQSATEVQVDVALTRKEMQEVSLSTRVIQDAVTGFESNIAYIQTMIQGLLQSHHDSQAQQLQAYLAQVQELVQGPTAECRTQERSLLSPSTHDDHTDSVLGRRITRSDGITSLSRVAWICTELDTCDCPRQKRRLHTQYRWGSTTFFTQTESIIYHLPGCKLARVNFQLPNDSSRTYGITFTGVRRIISKAAQLSISLNYRAGATSIAPIIKCQTVVDHTRTPAFRLVSLLNRWFELMESVHIREPGLLHASEIKHDVNRLIRHCFSGVLTSFHQKKGSPTNVDYLHQSLAHHLVTVMNNMGIFGFCYNFTKKLKFGLPNSDRTLLLDYDQFLRTFLDFLLSLRIPLITYDVDGRTPLSEILEYPSDDGVRVIVDTLSSEGNEVLPFFRFQGPRESLQASHKTMSWRLANIPVLAEACEVNPLCKAAYAGDEQGVTYLLSRNPAYIEDEIIALRKTAIHMAVGQPQCLRILVQYATPHILDKKDVHGASALQLAFNMCKHTNCQSLSTATARPNCACAESLEILLEAGCMHEFGFLYVPSEHSSDYASDAVVAYANNLVWRRKELKQIARLYIAEARHGDLGLNSRAVLDANVSEVVKTLQEMGICLDPKLYRSTTNRDGESIFHRITTPKVADLFYSLGFRDLSACTESMFPPCVNQLFCMPFVSWLYQHNINIFEPLESQLRKAPKDPRRAPICDLAPSSTAAHCIGHEVGRCAINTTKYLFSKEATTASSMTPVVLVDYADECSCECSKKGCTPLIASLKGIFVDAMFENSELYIDYLVTKLSKLLDLLTGTLNLEAMISVIRYSTYSALGIPHTCCIFDAGNLHRQHFIVKCDAVEVQEIQSENFGEIERFHQIFESLTEELKSVLAGKTEVDFATAKDYFETTWTERMKLETKDGIEDDIEDGIEDLVERTRELGVVWQGPLPSDSAHDDGLYEPTTQHITSLEFWMDEADRIVRGEETLVGV